MTPRKNYEEKVRFDVEYRGSRLRSPVESGPSMEFNLMFVFTLLKQYAEDNDINGEQRVVEAINTAFNDLEWNYEVVSGEHR